MDEDEGRQQEDKDEAEDGEAKENDGAGEVDPEQMGRAFLVVFLHSFPSFMSFRACFFAFSNCFR